MTTLLVIGITFSEVWFAEVSGMKLESAIRFLIRAQERHVGQHGAHTPFLAKSFTH